MEPPHTPAINLIKDWAQNPLFWAVLISFIIAFCFCCFCYPPKDENTNITTVDGHPYESNTINRYKIWIMSRQPDERPFLTDIGNQSQISLQIDT